MEFLMVVLYIMAYSVVGGFTFRAIANRTAHPRDPFRSIGPFMSGLLWPCILPAALGVTVARNTTRIDGKTRVQRKFAEAERRRQEELTEARHRVKVAELETARTRVLERALLEDED